MPDNELDVRTPRKPDKHPMIFAAFGALAVGGVELTRTLLARGGRRPQA